MDDDLKRRVQRASDEAPKGRPDLASVTHAARRAQRMRGGLLVSAAVVMVATSLIAVNALSGFGEQKPGPQEAGGHTGDGVFVPAQKGEATYLLSDFEIHYPYREIDHMPMSQEGREQHCSNEAFAFRCKTRWDKAGVSYAWRWATDQYPGDLECEIRLYDGDGIQVGGGITGLSGLESRSRDEARSVIPFDVSARPAFAEGECEAGRYEAGEGLRFTYKGWEPYTPEVSMGSTRIGQRIKLFFEVEHLVEHTDSRMCRITIRFESGRVVRGKFTTNSSEPFREMETGHPASDPPTDAEIVCGPIESS